MVAKQKPTVELTIPVLPDMELLATQTSAAVAKHMNLDDEKTAEINMALSEACINAFEHSESKSEIEIHFKISDDKLIIQVTDSGKGFDKSKVDIPNIEEKISSDYKRGWGLKLIEELMDTVKFDSSEEGTTVTMTKRK
ncbi:MAG: anti-sigma regulatory factor [Candidatus Marinimicrobia bacterium]|mgnify:FL=1|nr:anti-sigma regulatory factor [Candidatus Neomarinimicrobiota bacterium]|tara:strand:+ start:15455 stop:15871 length:417 start_codon:yes stop_codon:yes gene_type:complete